MKNRDGVFEWKGKLIETIGDLGSACAALENAKEGGEFFAAYLAVNVHAASNIGYVAGYFNRETMRRIHEYTGTTHPIFGRHEPTPEEAFELGKRMAADV